MAAVVASGARVKVTWRVRLVTAPVTVGAAPAAGGTRSSVTVGRRGDGLVAGRVGLARRAPVGAVGVGELIAASAPLGTLTVSTTCRWRRAPRPWRWRCPVAGEVHAARRASWRAGDDGRAARVGAVWSSVTSVADHRGGVAGGVGDGHADLVGAVGGAERDGRGAAARGDRRADRGAVGVEDLRGRPTPRPPAW